MKLSDVRITSAGALTPPNKGDTLVWITLVGGATPGALSPLHDGINTALLPVEGLASGPACERRYYVGQEFQGAFGSGGVAFLGGLAAVVFAWANTSERGRIPRPKDGDLVARDIFAAQGGSRWD